VTPHIFKFSVAFNTKALMPSCWNAEWSPQGSGNKTARNPPSNCALSKRGTSPRGQAMRHQRILRFWKGPISNELEQ
jgi:hypothetical protein